MCDCIKNIYGQSISESEWDNYINSSKGQAEYVLTIAIDAKESKLKTKQDVYDTYNFDEATVNNFITSWKNNRSEIRLNKKVISNTEAVIKQLGFSI